MRVPSKECEETVCCSGRRDTEDGGHPGGDREGGQLRRCGNAQRSSVLYRPAVQHGRHHRRRTEEGNTDMQMLQSHRKQIKSELK